MNKDCPIELLPDEAKQALQKRDAKAWQFWRWKDKGRLDLSNASFFGRGDLSEFDFSNADLRGANFFSAKLRNARLTRSDLSGANLNGTQLERIDAFGTIFRGARVQSTNFAGANLRKADFGNTEDDTFTNAAGANFTQADVQGARFPGANLRGACFRQSNLTEACLTGSDLRNSQIVDAQLKNTQLQGANLTAASLNGATLDGADLTGATLRNADLSNADLRGAKGLVLDSNLERNAHFGANASDPWSILRRTYTGPRLLFNLLFFVCFTLPYLTKLIFWSAVNKAQTLNTVMLSKAVADNDAVPNDIANLTRCLARECSSFPAWQIILGVDKGTAFWVLAIFLLSYNIMRAVLTWQVSSLRDESERSGYSPPWSGEKWWQGYRALYKTHRIVSFMFVMASAALIYNFWYWISLPIFIPT